MNVKGKIVSGPFWEKMNSEIFSYLEFHTQDEKARAEVRSFCQKHLFLNWTYSWWFWWSYSFMQIFIDQAQKKEDERKEEEMAEKIKASFRASEAQKTEWVYIDMAAQL